VTGIEVLSPGASTTVQDLPGRVGLWEVGVPPSGPMDDRSLRIGNELLGNPAGAAGLEATLTGPQLRFTGSAVIAVTGAPLAVALDGVPVPRWTAFEVPAGGVLRLGTVRDAGVRAYVLIRGGIDAPAVMGSRSAFAPAGLGGGRLRRGDVLPVGPPPPGAVADGPVDTPMFANTWTLRVVAGPHGAPDFLTAEGIAELWSATWTVHHQSDRTGVRLVGPAPSFSRADGGDAGLHPSNILDSAYGVGTVMLAGDMAVIVGPDGPSLGGFVAVAQVVRADRWRLGQLRADDEVRFVPVASGSSLRRTRVASPVLEAHDGSGGRVTHRRAGEGALLVEFGEPVLDLRSRVRVHALQEALRAEAIAGVLELTPGVRSLHVQFDPDRVRERDLVATVMRLEAGTPPVDALEIGARTVHLPLAWRESQTMLAVERYVSSVRADAPWCPDNIEFIRRVNGLVDEEEVRRIVLDAAYLVLGLGDVYLGAPVAVPLDPRHRLVTTKYSPARTWTPPNAVGIGGAFMCVYGMEGPGGYQLVGRTAPIWHSAEDPPWRLRHFDQIRFVSCDEDELAEVRAASEAGEWAPPTEPATFSLAAYEAFVAAHAEETAAFRTRREAAFAAERAAWGVPVGVREEAA